MPIPAAPLALDASLHLLADHLLDALRSDELEPSVLTVGDVDSDGFALRVRPLDGAHPTDLLLGHRCGPDVHAVGLAVCGWARRFPQWSDGPSEPHRVQVVTLLSRTGELAHRIHHETPEPIVVEEAPTGEQIDLMRRSLGLATDPPPWDSGLMWAMAWLLRIARSEAPVDSWTSLWSLHPAFDPGDVPTTRAGAQRRVRAFVRNSGWAEVRSDVIEGIHPNPMISPDEAAWLDEGSFARFVLNRLPSPDELRADALARLSPSLGAQLTGALDRIGVPRDVWRARRP